MRYTNFTRIGNAVTILGALAAAGCAADTTSNLSPVADEATGSTESAASVPSGSGSGAGALGVGYDVERQNFLGDCVSGTFELVDPGSGVLGFGRQMTREELSTDLGINAGGKAAFGPFNVSGGAKFALNVATNRYADTFVFESGVSGRTYRLAQPSIRKSAMDIRTSKGQAAAIEACGTEYVDSVKLAAKVYVAVKFEFADESVKSDFDANIHIDYLSLFSVDGSVKTAYSRLSKSINVSIYAYQVGGNPAALGEILGTGTTADANNGASAALVCSLDALTACNKALGNIGTYVSTSFPKQVNALPTQVPGSSQLPPGYGVATYETKAYKNAGLGALIEEESPIVAAAVKLARGQVLDRYMQLVQDRQRVTQLLRGSDFRLEPTHRTALNDAATKINRQIAEIEPVGIACYADLSKCAGTVAALLAKFDDKDQSSYYYDPAVLNKELGFYEYCMAGHRTPETQATLDAVSRYFGVEDGTCDEKSDEIEQASALDLRATVGKELSDLRPLRSARNLKYLRLRDHRVRNIGPIASLPKLERLDLRNNGLASIGRLASLKNLTELDVANNQLRDIAPLNELVKLEVLKAQNNPFIDPNVYVAPPTLRVKILNDNDICHTERQALLDAGEISQSVFTSNERRNWGPIYNTPGDNKSGVVSWVICRAVAGSLPSGL